MSLIKVSKEQPESFEFNSNNLEVVEKVISKYPEGKQQSAVMALLYIAVLCEELQVISKDQRKSQPT